MNKHVNDDILIKYLVGEASKEEKALVEAWIAASEENQKQYRDFQLLWTASEKLALRSKVDENLAWSRFQQRLDEAKPSVKTKKSSWSWSKIAAGIILVSLGAWAAFYAYNQSSLNQLIVKTGDYTKVDTLSDGSIITLNRHSKVQYPNHFANKHRTVKLIEGEAFFDVAPDANKPFHVVINDIDVKVVGTSFNIKINEEITELIVETGVVEVRKEHVVVRLKRDETVEIDRDSHDLKKGSVQDQLYKYYRNNKLIADGTPLYRVVDVLNDAYDVDIVIEGVELENLELNTTLTYNNSIQSNLDLICETFGIKMKKSGEQIVLYR